NASIVRSAGIFTQVPMRPSGRSALSFMNSFMRRLRVDVAPTHFLRHYRDALLIDAAGKLERAPTARSSTRQFIAPLRSSGRGPARQDCDDSGGNQHTSDGTPARSVLPSDPERASARDRPPTWRRTEPGNRV